MTRGEGGGEDLRLSTGIGTRCHKGGREVQWFRIGIRGGGEIGRLEGRGILKVTIERDGH